MKIHKILISLFTAVILCSCEKADDGDKLPDGIKSDLNFHTLEIVDVSYNSASLSVKHDGTSDDTWYGFVTDKIGTKDAVLIADKITELTTNGGLKKLDRRPSARIELTELQAAKNYKYIVFAITADGVLYGASRSIQFKTEESAFLFAQCDDWTVAYEGRDTGTNSENYSIVFKNGASRCHLGFIPKWKVESLEIENKDIIDEYGGLPLEFEEIGRLLFTPLDYCVYQEIIMYAQFYEEDSNYFEEETLKDDSIYNIGKRQESGDYYVVAIGWKNNLEPTFTYSVNEVSIPKETPSDEYNKWIGTWSVTGANNVKYTLEIVEYDPNYEYIVYGWECGPEHNEQCNDTCTEHITTNIDGLYEEGYKHFIPFYFDALNNNLNINSLVIQTNPGKDYSYYQYWGLHGFNEIDEQINLFPVANDLIAIAEVPEGSTTTLVGNTSGEFTYSEIGYALYDVANNEDQTISNISLMNKPMKLPATMEKINDSGTTPAKVATSAPSYKKERTEYYNPKTNNDFSKVIEAYLLSK